MLPYKPEPGTPGDLAIDNPAPLGELAAIVNDRNIAVAMAPDGHVLLVRPDSALVEVPVSPDRNNAVANLVDRYDATLARTIREGIVDKDVTFLKINFNGEQAPPRFGPEFRWSVSKVNEFLREAASTRDADGNPTPVHAEYNHVVIGAQTVRGSPLGVSASWAGEMAFIGEITQTKQGRPVMLTTADPSVPPAVLRDPLDIKGHRTPRVLVLDTGLRTVPVRTGGGRTVEHEELQRCHVHTNWLVDGTPGLVDDEDEELDPPVGPIPTGTRPPANPDQVLDFEAGHGTFIAGIVRQLCPDAEICSAGVLSSFGDGDVDGVTSNLKRVLAEIDGPVDIVVMSFGTNLIGDDPGFFGEELTRLLGDAVGVAAAGNQSTCRPYFPAALPNVIGVGGLAADGKAWFTNFGGWVDACAPAVDVVSTFFNDFQEVIDGQQKRHYEQWARWSGTSFSAPKVAAVIAQEMYLNQVTAKEAWKRVTSHKHLRYPDLGIVFNV